jgi:hypothetical protein
VVQILLSTSMWAKGSSYNCTPCVSEGATPQISQRNAMQEMSMLSSIPSLFAHPDQRRVARQVLRLVNNDVKRTPHPLRWILLLLLLQHHKRAAVSSVLSADEL